MAIGQIYLNEKEEEIIKRYVKEWNIPKYEAIRKIIEEFDKLKEAERKIIKEFDKLKKEFDEMKGGNKKDVQEKEEGHTDN